MLLEKAVQADFAAVCALYQAVCADMRAHGNHQWQWGGYPNETLVQGDIDAGTLYVLRQEGQIAAVAAADTCFEPVYDEVNWLFGIRPGSFHRFALAPQAQGHGLGRKLLMELLDILRGLGCDSLRCDTFSENHRALALYRSLGMRDAGAVYYEGEGDGKPFLTLEMPLTEDCPLLPLCMHPAFRGGKLTPWGGEKLRTVYGKPIAEVPTGESLEVSCIPGLESADDTGVKLPELIAKYGARFAGKYAAETFPLLLKFIDAAESLSVQVHPDDAYAHAHENGKLGKTEAWLILDAPQGSQLVYGIRQGTTLAELRTACEAGAAVEPLLRRVDVKPGDVCFIPAGCVHAIGAGIMLYEIQQSSDVTYRFYDWDRVDKQGKRRELHIDKALDVTDLAFTLDPIPAPDSPLARVLDEKYFTLDLMKPDGEQPVPDISHFGLLTALDDGLTLTWPGGRRALHKGESLFVPATAPALTLAGKGRAALSMPR